MGGDVSCTKTDNHVARLSGVPDHFWQLTQILQRAHILVTMRADTEYQFGMACAFNRVFASGIDRGNQRNIGFAEALGEILDRKSVV